MRFPINTCSQDILPSILETYFYLPLIQHYSNIPNIGYSCSQSSSMIPSPSSYPREKPPGHLPSSHSLHTLPNQRINSLPSPLNLSPKYLEKSLWPRPLPADCVQDLIFSRLECKHNCLTAGLRPNFYLVDSLSDISNTFYWIRSQYPLVLLLMSCDVLKQK